MSGGAGGGVDQEFEGDDDSGFQAENDGLLTPYSIASEDFAICRSTNF
jgi:hypothetical protein